MNTELARIAVIALTATAALTTFGADRSTDEAAIREAVQMRQQLAWNQHDAKAYAALFTEDGDVVNVVGWWWRGRAEIEKKLTDAFAFVFRGSALTIQHVGIRFLAPDVAVAHAYWTMSGARTSPTIPQPREGLQTLVVQKRGGKWMIAAFQNTNYVPEVPFPTQPPSAKPAAER